MGRRRLHGAGRILISENPVDINNREVSEIDKYITLSPDAVMSMW